jgi:hypothetical protein
MYIYRHDHNGGSIISLDHPERNQRAVVATRPPRRLVSIWGSNNLTLLVLIAGTIGLALFAFHIGRHDQELASVDETNESMLVHFAVRRIWLPQALVDLATNEPPTGAILTHKDLTRHFEIRGQEKMWYAMIVRSHDAEGDFVDIPFVRWPYNEPDLFHEFLKILALATGKPTGEPNGWLSTASSSLLPDGLLKRDPREAVADLLNDPVASLSADFVDPDDQQAFRRHDRE